MKVDPAAILAVALLFMGMVGIAMAYTDMTDGGSDTDSIEPEIVSQTEG